MVRWCLSRSRYVSKTQLGTSAGSDPIYIYMQCYFQLSVMINIQNAWLTVFSTSLAGESLHILQDAQLEGSLACISCKSQELSVSRLNAYHRHIGTVDRWFCFRGRSGTRPVPSCLTRAWVDV